MALFVPLAAFYIFVFSMFLEGWPSTGSTGLEAYRDLYFWLFYVAPAFAVIAFAGRIFPSKHRKIDWIALTLLFLGIYLLTPRVCA